MTKKLQKQEHHHHHVVYDPTRTEILVVGTCMHTYVYIYIGTYVCLSICRCLLYICLFFRMNWIRFRCSCCFFVGYATAAVALQYSMPLTYLNLLYRFISIRLNTRHCFRIEPIQTALLRAAMWCVLGSKWWVCSLAGLCIMCVCVLTRRMRPCPAGQWTS